MRHYVNTSLVCTSTHAMKHSVFLSNPQLTEAPAYFICYYKLHRIRATTIHPTAYREAPTCCSLLLEHTTIRQSVSYNYHIFSGNTIWHREPGSKANGERSSPSLSFSLVLT